MRLTEQARNSGRRFVAAVSYMLEVRKLPSMSINGDAEGQNFLAHLRRIIKQNSKGKVVSKTESALSTHALRDFACTSWIN